MGFTRSPVMRAVALVASLALVVLHWDDRGTWFWIGLVLLVANATGIVRARRSGRPSASAAPTPSTPSNRASYRLAEMSHVPGVATAVAAGPAQWRQVSYLGDFAVDPVSPLELAEHIWLERDDAWEIGLGDEVKPYLDLDIDEDADPIVRVLRDHPAVADAYHEDREVYRVEERRPIGVEEFAALAARALVSHHLLVAGR